MAKVTERYIWLDDCGSCGAYHRPDFDGDCRNDTERFPLPVLDTHTGENLEYPKEAHHA